MSNQNTKKSPGIEFSVSSCTREMGMDNFGHLNSSLSSFYFYCVTRLEKNLTYVRLQLNLPLSVIRASTLLVGPSLPPFEREYFMGDPYWINLLVFDYQWLNCLFVSKQCYNLLNLYLKRKIWFLQNFLLSLKCFILKLNGNNKILFFGVD